MFMAERESKKKKIIFFFFFLPISTNSYVGYRISSLVTTMRASLSFLSYCIGFHRMKEPTSK